MSNIFPLRIVHWGHEAACGYLADTVESRRNPVKSLNCRRTSSGARPARPGPVERFAGAS